MSCIIQIAQMMISRSLTPYCLVHGCVCFSELYDASIIRVEVCKMNSWLNYMDTMQSAYVN
jgi:hypothetical protein